MKVVRYLIAILFLPVLSFGQCIKTFPYSENFNGSGWVIPPTTTQTGAIDPCWDRNPSTNTYMWVTGPSVIINNFTGPLTDKDGNGKFAYTESVSFVNPPQPAFLTSPPISLVGTTAPQVSFWYYMFGSQIGQLQLQVNNGGTWTTVNGTTVNGQQQTNNSSAWVKVTASLAGFVGDTIQLRFRGTKNNISNLSRIAVDNLVVEETPTCAPVTNLYTTGTTATQTTIGWFVGSATSTSWEIEYGPAGFVQGNGTLVTVTTNPATISGLSGSTTYAFYVREVCSPTDKSPWTGPQYTTTQCSGAINPPYTENFDGPTWQPFVNTLNPGSVAPCWSSNPTGFPNYQWLVNPNNLTSLNSGPSSDHTSGFGKYVASQALGGTNTSANLRSPQINLAAVANPELKFWYHMYGSDIASLVVEIQTQGSTTWNNLITINGQQQSSSSASWQQVTVSLAPYATQIVYIRFRGSRVGTSGTSCKIAVDDLSILPGSTCPIPSGLTVNNINSNSASVAFTGTLGGQYQVKYGLQGFNVNTQGTSVLTPTSPITIAPLTQNTTYDVYVRKLCTTDTSTWFGPFTFTTPCIVNAPYNETFTAASWVVGGTFPNVLGEINNCWSRTTNTTYYWMPGPESFPSFQTGPSADHTTGTGKYLFTSTQTFGGTNPLTADAITPQINLVPLNTPELTFWYHMYGSQIGTLLVQINNGSGWTTIKTLTGQQQASKTAPWLEEIINLSAYADDTIRLRFRASKNINTFNTEVAIDDISIHELPTCPKPTNFASGNATFNSVQLSWTTGGATRWLIKYGPPGFTSGTITASITNPRVIMGLNPNTNYEFWVRDSCGVNNVSQWVGPILVKTACNPSFAPYTENFSSASFVQWNFTDQEGKISNCYRRADSTAFYWVPGPAPFPSTQSGPSGDHTTGSGKFMYTRTSVFPQNQPVSTNLLSPYVDLGSLAQPQLRFWYHMYGNNISKLEVRIRKYDGTTTLVKTITGQQQFSKTSPWLQEVINLNAYVGQVVRVIFTSYSTGAGFNSEIAIDDIEIGNPLACAAPTNLSVGAITSTSVTLSWTSSINKAGCIIEYGPPGFTPGTGTSINVGGSPFTITGLAPNTAYQFYVRDSCTWGGLSTWLGPQGGTTLPCPAITGSFTATPTGLNVVFNATASGPNATTYAWNYGDGNTGTGVTPSHTYSTGGNYTVTLIVYNSCGSADTVVQTVSTCVAIGGQFTAGISGLSVSFGTAAVTGSGLQYSWLFGDGNTGSGPSPSHAYAIDGIYNVQLIVADLCGNVDTISQSITVCAPMLPVVQFTQNGLDVNFSVVGAAGGTNYNWNFGDGNTGSGATPMHTYLSTGTYNVSVVVTNLCGQQSTAFVTITLCTLPKAAWTYTIISSSASGMVVQFNGSASIGASSFLWEFGDGATNSTSAIPVHTYSVAGLFWIVKLTVFNDCGDSDFMRSSLAAIGIEDFEAAGVKIFPNPADDEVVLLLPEFIGLHAAELMSSNGSVMSTVTKTEHGEIRFATANLPEGTYFIRLKADAGEAVFKVVVKH